jgi:hypothetical protein
MNHLSLIPDRESLILESLNRESLNLKSNWLTIYPQGLSIC